MCKGIAGYLFGHKFKTVITLDRVQLPNRTLEIRGHHLDQFRNENFHAIYCERCGKTIEKEDFK